MQVMASHAIRRLELALQRLQHECEPTPTTHAQSSGSQVYEINRIVMATSVVGSISLVACFVVTLVIVASKRDKDSVRDRVILGLMFANAV